MALFPKIKIIYVDKSRGNGILLTVVNTRLEVLGRRD